MPPAAWSPLSFSCGRNPKMPNRSRKRTWSRGRGLSNGIRTRVSGPVRSVLKKRGTWRRLFSSVDVADILTQIEGIAWGGPRQVAGSHVYQGLAPRNGRANLFRQEGPRHENGCTGVLLDCDCHIAGLGAKRPRLRRSPEDQRIGGRHDLCDARPDYGPVRSRDTRQEHGGGEAEEQRHA